MALSRDRIQQLIGNARTAERAPLALPDLGETVWVRRLTRAEQLKAANHAVSGADGDEEARGFVAALRFALVDDDGRPLMVNYDEAAQFLNMLSPADFAVLLGQIGEVLAAIDAGDGGEGKGH